MADSKKSSAEGKVTKKKGKSKVMIIGLITCGCLLLCCIVATIVSGVVIYLNRDKGKGPVYNKEPFVDILEPSGNDSYATYEDKIVLSGIASDDGEVSKIEWEVEGGSSGTASGTKDWQTESINLKEGDNKIKITAYDKDDNAGEDIITITYNEDILFVKEPKLSQDSIFKDDPAVEITIQANISSESGKKISSVKLYEVDTDGEITKEIGPMLDNGKVENGDDIPSDGTYAIKSKFGSKTNESKRLRIIAKTEGSDKSGKSGVFKIVVVDHVSEQTQDQIDDLNQQVQDLMDQLNQQNANQQQIANDILNTVQNNPNVTASGMSENGQGVWWVYENTCIPGGVLVNPPNTKGNTFQADSTFDTQVLFPQNNTNMMMSPVNAAGNEVNVKNTKAIYLGPYLSDFGDTDDYYGAWKVIKDSKCPECEMVEKKNKEVTVEDFKNLDQYGIIVISSHGDNWYGGLSGDNVCAQGLSQSQIITYTDQDATPELIKKYEADLMQRRLAIGYDNKFIILPSFISHYNSGFPNSLVYVATCRSSYNNTLASAFLGDGAEVYYGFDDYVLSSYCKDVGINLFENFLIEGDNASTSFSDTVSSAGSSDGQGADFEMIGTDELLMGGKDFENVGFEEGDLNGWGGQGDKRIVTSLGPLKPTEGSFMAIISTGLGSVQDSNSTITQSICYGKKGGTLKFDYNLVSEEPMEYVDSEFDDRLEVTIVVNGQTTKILDKGVSDSNWKGVSGIDFAGGDTTTYQTGWLTKSYDLSSIKPGDKIAITFKVYDKGDSDYDTAALIDKIRIE